MHIIGGTNLGKFANDRRDNNFGSVSRFYKSFGNFVERTTEKV
jgi:hypothetical protein